MSTVEIKYHCVNKKRINDDHTFYRMKRSYARADGANTTIASIKAEACKHCGGSMMEGDVVELKKRRK